MNDLRLLQQIDPNKKIISLEFKYFIHQLQANQFTIANASIAHKV